MNIALKAVLGLALLAGLGLTAARPAAAQTGTILGGYLDDSPEIVINNTGGVVFTGVTLTGEYGGQTSVVNYADIAAGGSFTASEGNTPFSYDPDDSMGEFPITFSALANGQSLSITFSPSANSTGGFVDFEGTGPDNDSNPVVVAEIAPPAPAPAAVPEPSSVASMGLGGVGLLGLLLRARKRRTAA